MCYTEDCEEYSSIRQVRCREPKVANDQLLHNAGATLVIS